MSMAIWPARAQDDRLLLSLPIDCKLGIDCFVQKYVDVDPAPEVLDYACGQATNEGHKGTDIRVLSTKIADQGVAVLAAAPGVVQAIRDGMPDEFVTEDKIEKITKRACGNGVLIYHGDGWRTQYCHMRRGSILVRKGDQVGRGDKIGQVGYSGMTEFPHVHFAVRLHDEVIDPFTGKFPDGECKLTTEGSLWDPELITPLKYHDGELIKLGFADRPVDKNDAEHGLFDEFTFTDETKKLVVYARFINLKQGDRVRLVLDGPNGNLADSTGDPVDRAKALYIRYGGRDRPVDGWPKGTYTGRYELIRGGEVKLNGAAKISLK